jgi:VCBS repeat-containing protein
MLKQYKILVNEGKGSDNALITVPAGAGARGNPTRITAKPDTRYELQDDLKGKGLGPDQVRGKRVGKNLYLMFEDNGKPDVIIEGYYDPANLQQMPTIVGKAENGSIYEYIPHDPELSSMSTTLKDGTTPAILSLGGGPIAGGAFELAGLPIAAAAAAGGGLGGLGLAAAGLGAAALGGGGGGGGGGTPDTTSPNGGKAPGVMIEADNATDNKYLNKAEFEVVNKPAKLKVYASFDSVNKTVTTDDFVVFTVNGVAQNPRQLTTAEVTAGKAYIDVDTPAEDGKVTVTAYLQDASKNKTEVGSDETTLDTIAPNADPFNSSTPVAPLIHIDNDKAEPGNSDGDTYVNAAEFATYNGFFQVTAKFNANVKLGDSVTFNAKEILGAAISTRPAITRLLTADEIKLGSAIEKFAAPEEGSTLEVTALLEDAAQNKSLLSNADSATLKKDLPTATSGLAPVSDTGVGTDKNTDGITDDATPLIHVSSGSTITKIVLKNITPGVVDNNPLSIPVSIDANGNVQVPSGLAVGKYKPYITVVDSVKNENTVEGVEFIVTKILGVSDTNSVQEGSLNILETSITNANALSNDRDDYSELVQLQPAKVLNISASFYNDAGIYKSVSLGQKYSTKYGEFLISSDGKYSYTLTAAAQKLVSGPPVYENFKYTVTSQDGFSVSDISLNIAILGADDPASIAMKNGSTTGTNLVKSYATSGANGGDDILVTDLDAGQSYLTYVGLTQPMSNSGNSYDFSGGVGGTFKLILQVPTQGEIDNSSLRYKWEYGYNKTGYGSISNITAGVTFHDLLTVSSADGYSSKTIEAIVGSTNGSETTDKTHLFYAPTTAKLTATGHSDASFIDKLFVKGDGLLLDLTAVTTNVSNMDTFDITGTTAQPGAAANTIKLDINALTQAATVGPDSHHMLHIIGDNGDKVVIVGGLGTVWTQSQASFNGQQDWIYTRVGTNDQLVIDAHITANNISFVAS